MAPPRVPDGCPLTPREFEVLGTLCETGSYIETSRVLNITRSTVTSHISNAHHKLGVQGSTAAMAVMGRNGWIGWQPPQDAPVEPQQVTPLAVEHPFLAAYLQEFERSRWPHEPDARSELGMRLALAGHRNRKGR